MKTLLVLVAVLGLTTAVGAADNVYQTSKTLSLGQYGANCASIGGTYESHDDNTGTCSKSGGYNVTCSRDEGITTCVGYDPKRPKAPQ